MGDAKSFRNESIPFAEFINVENTLVDPEGVFPNSYPPKEIVKHRMEDLGVELNDTGKYFNNF